MKFYEIQRTILEIHPKADIPISYSIIYEIESETVHWFHTREKMF